MNILTGNEPFTSDGKPIGLNIIDFWRFQCSNIMHDIFEVAEFLVAKSLGLEYPNNKDGWTVYDINYKGVRIEVKETSYYHSFTEPGKVSKKRSFGIGKSISGHDEVTGKPVYERQNDIYVFCLLNGDDEQTAWPLELSHWEFYVVPTEIINKRFDQQKTVSLSRIREISTAVSFDQLKKTIDETILSLNYKIQL